MNKSLYTNTIYAWVISSIIGLALPSHTRGQDARESPPDRDAISAYEYKFPALGTLVTFKAFSADEKQVEQAFELARKRVEDLGKRLSDYIDESETSLLPQQAADKFVEPSPDMLELLQSADRWHRRSMGTFDASLGVLTKLYRKYRRRDILPPKEKIEAALVHCGWNDVQLSESGKIKFLDPKSKLDFGAIGKGFIVDKAFKILQTHGLESCMVDISGNIRCGVPPPGYAGWKIAVAPLEKGGTPLRQIELNNQAIATSGDLWQYVVVDGIRRSHIIDPRTGIGVAGPISASVVAETATDADAMATVACVLKPEQTLRLTKEYGLHVLVARKNGDKLEIVSSPDFPVGKRAP